MRRRQLVRELDAGAHAQLRVDVAQVGLDRLGAEEELLGDLAVRPPGGHERGDLALAVGEGAERLAGPAATT